MSKYTFCWVSDDISNPGKDSGYIEIVLYPKTKNRFETITHAIA